MPDHPRITLDPAVVAGKPIIRGTRISVEFVLELMAAGWSAEGILANYPHLRPEDLAACLDYAKELVSAERVFPGAA